VPKWLCQDVGELGLCSDEQDVDPSLRDALLDEMISCVDVLAAVMVDWIFAEGNS
jgi:hypothetical protein